MKQHTYSLALRRVAPHLAQHPVGYDMLRTLADLERMDCDGFDTASGVYWIGYLWHGGQNCPLYAALCASEYNPGVNEHGPDPATGTSLVFSELNSILIQES